MSLFETPDRCVGQLKGNAVERPGIDTQAQQHKLYFPNQLACYQGIVLCHGSGGGLRPPRSGERHYKTEQHKQDQNPGAIQFHCRPVPPCQAAWIKFFAS